MGRQLREIEAKYRVSDIATVEQALAMRGFILSAPVHQDDQAYAPAGWHYGMSKHGVVFARLRTQSGRHLFTLKKPLENEMDCLEHETQIDDRSAMHLAVLAMGFYPTVRITKVRRAATLGDISVCLDEVVQAGTFLEVERVVDSSQSGVEIQTQLAEFVQSLGIEAERTVDTYDSLVRNARLLASV